MTDMSDPTNAAEDRRQHLGFIQTVIARMSTTSTVAKGWCLTVATAALGFAITRNSRGVGLLGGLTVVLFGLLDARYLREERKFRSLYDDVRCGRCVTYDMNTQPYVDSGHDRFDASCTWPSVMRSWSLWAFYGPLLLMTAVVVVRAWINQ